MDIAAKPDDLPSAPRIRCLLIADLVDSTALIDRLGDREATELLRRHDGLVRGLIHQHGGREIDKTDGFLILFERPIEAVGFALDYQKGIAELGGGRGSAMQARIGIHVGEVLTWHNPAEDVAEGAKPLEVEGLAKSVAARLMYLALPGQILLSETAHTLALRARHELRQAQPPSWLAHGRYQLHGVAAPMGVFEVGEAGRAPLRRPTSKEKAHRVLAWWQSRWLWAALLVLASGLSLYAFLRPKPAIAFAQRDWIVVGDVRNLTGDSRFDHSLDTALRLGLEQSRYLNLVSPLRTRDALQWMQRPPDTLIDRDVGSEVAQRIGARAVLLPSLADLGGRLRFTGELVDPYSGVTVYSDSAEIADPDHLLPAVDAVLREVRGNLGESLASVEKSSRPLDQVTTPDMEALRAYSLALIAKREQRLLDARKLLERAIELDPEFGMAYLARASLALMDSDLATADQDFDKAASLSHRLTHRERLLLEASRSLGNPTRDMISAWSVYADMYPDDDRAAYNLALFAIELANDCSFALKRLGSVVGEATGLRVHRLYEIARCRLMRGDLDLAETIFTEANSSGLIGNGPEYAQLLALRGDFNRALGVLDLQNDTRPRAEREQAEVSRVAIRYLRDGLPALAPALAHLQSLRDGFSPAAQSTVDLMMLSVASQDDPDGSTASLSRHITGLIDASTQARPSERLIQVAQAAAAAWWAARQGLAIPAETAAQLDAISGRVGHTPAEHLIRLAEAERMLRADRAAEAQQLVDTIDPEVAPFVWHATRMRVRLALGRNDDAVEDCTWMQRNTGRALAERVADGALVLVNLFERESCRRRLAAEL